MINNNYHSQYFSLGNFLRKTSHLFANYNYIYYNKNIVINDDYYFELSEMEKISMLILTRKRSEAIIIGDNVIKFKILSIGEKKVKIGVECDKNISVHREEIYNKIKNQGENINGQASRDDERAD